MHCQPPPPLTPPPPGSTFLVAVLTLTHVLDLSPSPIRQSTWVLCVDRYFSSAIWLQMFQYADFKALRAWADSQALENTNANKKAKIMQTSVLVITLCVSP